MADHAKASRADLVKAAVRSARAAADAGARAARETWNGSDESAGTSRSSPSGTGSTAARAEPDAPRAPRAQPSSPAAGTAPDEASSRRITEAEAVLRRRVDALKAADYKGGAMDGERAGSDDAAHQMKVQEAVTQYVHALREAVGASAAREQNETEDATVRLVRDALNGLYLAGVWDGRTSEPGERSGA